MQLIEECIEMSQRDDVHHPVTDLQGKHVVVPLLRETTGHVGQRQA
jgi:hypothetical protein